MNDRSFSGLLNVSGSTPEDARDFKLQVIRLIVRNDETVAFHFFAKDPTGDWSVDDVAPQPKSGCPIPFNTNVFFANGEVDDDAKVEFRQVMIDKTGCQVEARILVGKELYGLSGSLDPLHS